MEPAILPIGVHYRYGETTLTVPATRLAVERAGGERSRVTVDLAFRGLDQWLATTPTLLAAVAAGAGAIIPVPPVYPDGTGFLIWDGQEVAYGIALGEFVPYDLDGDGLVMRLTGVGPEVYSGLWSGGEEFPAGTKVADVLAQLAAREEAGKERWGFRPVAIPDSYVLPYNYPMAGRTAVEAVQDLCRSYGLVYELRRHRGRTTLYVYGPAAAPITSMDPWPKAGYRDGYPPAYVRIVPGVGPMGVMAMAQDASGTMWRDILRGGGKRGAPPLGQAEAPVTALDGLPLLARIGLAKRDERRYSGLLGQVEEIISSAVKGVQEHWAELRRLLQGVDTRRRVLEVTPLEWPRLRFEPPEGDLLKAPRVTGNDTLQYEYSPPMTTEDAMRVLKGVPGVKIGEAGDNVRITMPDGNTVEVKRGEVVYIVRDPKTRSPVSLLVQGTLGQGDLANYYPYQLEVELPATPFYTPWHAVELAGWGGFLNGWWRILSTSVEYGEGRWVARLVLGRKDFPWG